MVSKFRKFVRRVNSFRRNVLGRKATNQVYSITISTEGLTQEQINLLKELEAKGLIPKITWIESGCGNGADDKIKYALLYLHSDEAQSLNCKIRWGYDYAWIILALNSGPIPNRYCVLRHKSTPKYVNYIKPLGFTDIAGFQTLNKMLAKAKWLPKENKLYFHGCHISISESKRRNNIASKFIELMNEV